MSEVNEKGPTGEHAWLVRVKGLEGPARSLLRSPLTRIGRHPGNDLVIDASTVSSFHCEIRWEHGAYWLYDLNSTNGTFLNGNSVERARLNTESQIRFGSAGPEFAFTREQLPLSELDQTVMVSSGDAEHDVQADRPTPSGASASVSSKDEELLSNAVRRAREARQMGLLDQTQHFMREALGLSKRRSDRAWRQITSALLVTLLAVVGFAYWKVRDVRQDKSELDRRIERIEENLLAGGLSDAEIEDLMERLDEYQRQAQALQSNLLFRWGILGQEQLFIQQELRTLLRSFGAESYSIPPDFVEQVNRFIQRYQTRDRRHVERVLGESQAELQTMRRIFEEAKLPGDLAYMAMVESAFLAGSNSRAGAAGPWQFRPATARQYGLEVNREVDERYDVEKSTQAAARYIRKLILDFGAGSSVMLALAAYNGGPTKVRRAVRQLDDPIQQRNFWYLYRTRSLPLETREYIPKIFAAILIGRHPQRYGF